MQIIIIYELIHPSPNDDSNTSPRPIMQQLAAKISPKQEESIRNKKTQKSDGPSARNFSRHAVGGK